MNAHLCPRCSSACLCPRATSSCEHNCSRLEAMRRQLATEIRDDVLAGRGRLPRDRRGRVDAGYLDELTKSGIPKPGRARGAHRAELVELERPQEREIPRRPGLESLTALLAGAAIAPAAESLLTRVGRLEALERDLSRFLAESAPHIWREIRAPLRRLINRARRELRAADRADLT